ncbi:acetyl-CoA carboxylase biotin carboxylase subunit [Alphaproteobacteria bacterium]|nr:acetyl-CoA carboxylase biotin carboxylase subunit [Alphaproteobacteria bacterium]
MFNKILIANRGEIAVRIIRACKELGVKTVAVHSDVDHEAMHVKLADESVCIGKSNAASSYLNIPNILSAINITGADAVHPGYGFLSESEKFAEILEKYNVKFIGPSAKSILSLGNKNNALKLAKKYKIPILGSGEDGTIQNIKEAKEFAKKFNYPVVIKASYGGGGRGMRVFYSDDEIDDHFSNLKIEAKNYFGNDALYGEKFLSNAKHIEFQIVADPKRNIINIIGQRDCSVQRKNQKLIEEIPSDYVNIKNIKTVIKNIKKMLKDTEYEGLGTLEFLYQDNEVFFIEMNTRLQVEHPVTEEAFNCDLVKKQIRIAAGDKIKTNDVHLSHSIECRINAENSKNFTPSPGKINYINIPGGRGVRVDTAIYTNYNVSPHYDSLVLKLICKAPKREEAIKIMLRSLNELIIEGIDTNIELHKWILTQKEFLNGSYSTNWLEKVITKF